MLAVLACVGALAADVPAARAAPADVAVDVTQAPRRAPYAVGASLGLGFVSQPALDLHVGAFVRSRFSRAFLLRGDVTADVGAGNAVFTVDAASQFVHDIDDAVEIAIGGGPAGGVILSDDIAVDDDDTRLDGFLGIVGITSATIAPARWWSLGLELRGLVAIMLPTAQLLVTPSLSVTTMFKF